MASPMRSTVLPWAFLITTFGRAAVKLHSTRQHHAACERLSQASASCTKVCGELRDIERERVFVGLRRLERRQLAGQQRWRHVVAAAPGHALREHVGRARQIHQRKVAGLLAKRVAIAALERRTRQHHRLASAPRGPEPCAQGQQPALAIGVGERHAGDHARHVFGWMELVAFEERGTEIFRQRCANGALAAAGHAHHDHGAHAG